ncbi:MAG: cytidylate kinase-like family protein [Thiohalomonadaceae bacterium]
MFKTTRLQDQALIQSIINAELIFQRHQPTAAGLPPVVAMSREYGTGGDEIARLLAERLQVDFYDQKILDHISHDTYISTEKLSELEDKSSTDKVMSWLQDLFSHNTTYPSYYRHHLVNVILRVARSGGLILGRGAHIILASHPAFRLRIVGGIEECVDRVMQEESLNSADARKKISKINLERENYLFNLFGRHLHDASLFDLVINTDRFQDDHAVVELVLHAMRQSGCTVPSQQGRAL